MYANLTTIPVDARNTYPTGKAMLEAVVSGTVKFVNVRANGTTRHVPYLAPGTEARTTAEALLADRNAGKTVATIATERNLSVPTIRRALAHLTLAVELENGARARSAAKKAPASTTARKAPAAKKAPAASAKKAPRAKAAASAK